MLAGGNILQRLGGVKVLGETKFQSPNESLYLLGVVVSSSPPPHAPQWWNCQVGDWSV